RAGLDDQRPYRGTSDTEVLLRALGERGPGVVGEFNGIFALAYLDERRGELVLARDRFGIKPLYVARDAERFYFASEIKAMLAGGLRAAANPLAALDFVFTGWTADHRTMFRGVRRVPPGSIVRLDLATGRETWERYYVPRPRWRHAERLDGRAEPWEQALAATLEQAVGDQLMSDVPVGTFCSGGIDSSLVTALAARHHRGLTAFNVACPDDAHLDEGPYAEQAARHVGVELRTVNLTRELFRGSLAHMVWVNEYPLSLINAVPLYLLSRLARETGVKVLLSGEGADELFGGYVGQYRRIALRRVAASKGRIGELALGRGLGLLTRAGARIGLEPEARAHETMHDALLGGLRFGTIRGTALEDYARLDDAIERDLAVELACQLQTYILPILHRTDRASMAASVEARVPFLDSRVAELALEMPPAHKLGVRGLRPVGKAILKRVAERFLPRDLVHRPKMGFTVPPQYYTGAWPERWLREGFVVSEFELLPEELRRWTLAQRGQVAAWMLSLEMWGQMFIQGRSQDQINDEFLGAEPVARA
ncbi:MAG TPA: asparagine synthase (glutamine-hydrolyzing), partial [Phycisphaerales bacterium]|nr:asparagine synthase (glutamine-hydrolyzing) [Phycisphaerales bacterium]